MDEARVRDFVSFSLMPTKAIDKLERGDFRKRMILLDLILKPEPVREFEANVHV
jgi:GTPase